VFKDGYIFFSVGERVDQDKAQDLGSPLGKIHRLHDDGRVPNDNPFVKTEGALATIWSYGHRNPQGMALSPDGKHVWAVEHGPRGGDELNLILKGRNYGWPLVSFGTNYDGTLISESPWREGTEPPVQQWTPSLGVSQAVFYTGNQFPLWRNQLLVASLGQQQLRMVKLDNNNKLVSDTLILQNLGRIRDVVSGPDGYPYLVISHPYGKIYRLTPAK
jgi:aldose sugar dehydrogenase